MLSFAAVHTRPDIAARVGELQSMVGRATVNESNMANKFLHDAKENKVALMVLPIHPEEVTYCAFSDASFSSGSKTGA